MRRAGGHWPALRLAALDWLVLESRSERFLERLFAGLCARLVEDGLPIARSTLHLRTLHPQFFGARLVWRPGQEVAETSLFEHAAASDRRFLDPMLIDAARLGPCAAPGGVLVDYPAAWAAKRATLAAAWARFDRRDPGFQAAVLRHDLLRGTRRPVEPWRHPAWSAWPQIRRQSVSRNESGSCAERS